MSVPNSQSSLIPFSQFFVFPSHTMNFRIKKWNFCHVSPFLSTNESNIFSLCYRKKEIDCRAFFENFFCLFVFCSQASGQALRSFRKTLRLRITFPIFSFRWSLLFIITFLKSLGALLQCWPCYHPELPPIVWIPAPHSVFSFQLVCATTSMIIALWSHRILQYTDLSIFLPIHQHSL